VVDFVTEFASGHGTHVTSTITGYNLNGEWISGIAPGVTIIPVRVLDAWIVPGTDGLLYGFSGGFNDMIAAGIYYIADLAPLLDAPVVINMSLGGGYSSMIEAAIDYAISQGVIVVTSAGNEGESGLSYPGALPQVISVGAVGWTDMFAQPDLWRADVPERLYKDDSLGNDYQVYLESFSSRPNLDIGQTADLLDISAPGAWVVGPYKSTFASDTGYYYLSGTSMASPHAAGIVANILQSFPCFDQEDMENILTLAASGEFLNKLRGFPSSGEDVVVAFPFNADGFYTVSWEEDDFGSGFLHADAAMLTAGIYAFLKLLGLT
jgi:subtilisin family serine protease